MQHLKDISSLIAAASQNLKPVRFLNYQYLRTHVDFFKNGYIIKCIIEIKQWVWWAQSTESTSGHTLQSTNGMHPPVYISLQKL